ncbi:MAG: 4'-phosphopantetheinyl transferase superfamily protein [Bacillota bacterium]
MTISQHMLELLRKSLHASELQVYAKPEWGSDNPEHRILLHTERDKLLAQTKDKLYWSISHAKGMGILVLCNKPVGVDVEVISRVHEGVVKRVSNPAEVSSAPTASALWTAKEAAFKATREFNQPSVLCDISIGDWKNIESQLETFALLNFRTHGLPSGEHGACLEISAHCFGFFVAHS